MNQGQKDGTVCRWLRIAKITDQPHIARVARTAYAMEWRGRHIVRDVLPDAGYCLDSTVTEWEAHR